ncbi:hypothetical protein DC74_2045 [Streptomyces noursei]|nr:hypothetical protein DC74_2045 [Streptomyces noursei]
MPSTKHSLATSPIGTKPDPTWHFAPFGVVAAFSAHPAESPWKSPGRESKIPQIPAMPWLPNRRTRDIEPEIDSWGNGLKPETHPLRARQGSCRTVLPDRIGSFFPRQSTCHGLAHLVPLCAAQRRPRSSCTPPFAFRELQYRTATFPRAPVQHTASPGWEPPPCAWSGHERHAALVHGTGTAPAHGPLRRRHRERGRQRVTGLAESELPGGPSVHVAAVAVADRTAVRSPTSMTAPFYGGGLLPAHGRGMSGRHRRSPSISWPSPASRSNTQKTLVVMKRVYSPLKQIWLTPSPRAPSASPDSPGHSACSTVATAPPKPGRAHPPREQDHTTNFRPIAHIRHCNNVSHENVKNSWERSRR